MRLCNISSNAQADKSLFAVVRQNREEMALVCIMDLTNMAKTEEKTQSEVVSSEIHTRLNRMTLNFHSRIKY